MIKNHDKYLKKLKMYAKSRNIKIQHKNNFEYEGCFYPNWRLIVLDADLEDDEEIAILLHELGHTLDDLIQTKEVQHQYDLAKVSKKADKAIMDAEKRAWNFAKLIAKDLRIPLGKWFYYYKKICLNSYRNP